jgi:predicted ATPase
LVATQRIVTLTGPGGIGKTRVAIAAARQLLPRFPDGVWFAELAPLTNGDLVADTVAAILGIEFGGAASLARIAKSLGSKRVLLILDNCEHVIDHAAATAEAVARANSNCRVLATSRERLRAEGEWTYPVPPLEVPAPDTQDLPDWRHRGAVGLFFARALAVDPSFSADAWRIALVGAVCRRLDGIPLAIELAAARAATLGLAELAGRLDDRFNLLTGGRRTALPRQHTLRATLDWSYALLSARERTILWRAAIFVGGFRLEAAIAVAGNAGTTRSDVIEGIASLVAKSLIALDDAEPASRWRMLETTRAYAFEKLTESGELALVARRHAEYYRDFFSRAETEANTRSVTEWLPTYRRDLDNLRAALDWAFSPSGDAATGIGLTIAGVPLWTHLSLMQECRGWAKRALASVRAMENPDRRCEMRLSTALGAALMYTQLGPEPRAAFMQALGIAESLHDTDYRLRALWSLWVDRMNDGALADSLTLAEKLRSLAEDSVDPIAKAIGHRTMGFTLHFLGEQADARKYLEQMLTSYVPAPRERPVLRFHFDPWFTAQMRLGVILWLQGYPNQAMRTVEQYIDDAVGINHPGTLCNGLASGACPAALLSGDLNAAERWVTTSLESAERFGLMWETDARCLQGILFIRRGQIARGLNIILDTLREFFNAMSHSRYEMFFAALADALGQIGDVAGGLAAVERALERTAQTNSKWYLAEFLRIKGELTLSENRCGAESAAETLFKESHDLARHQGALSWELRTATSLARLYDKQGQITRAREALAPVYARFTEGFETADLMASRALLDALR